MPLCLIYNNYQTIRLSRRRIPTHSCLRQSRRKSGFNPNLKPPVYFSPQRVKKTKERKDASLFVPIGERGVCLLTRPTSACLKSAGVPANPSLRNACRQGTEDWGQGALPALPVILRLPPIILRIPPIILRLPPVIPGLPPVILSEAKNLLLYSYDNERIAQASFDHTFSHPPFGP